MILRCNRCGRILARAAATLETAQGRALFGPACAVRAGLVPEPKRQVLVRSRRVRDNGRQMVLEVAAA